MMKAVLLSPDRAFAAGAVLAGILFLLYLGLGGSLDHAFGAFVLRWVHVVAAIIWVGLIWFVNFVQLPALAALDDSGRATVMSAIAPNVAWWFRHAATVTVAAGLLLAFANGYALDALTLGAVSGFAVPKHIMLGIGMWLGLAMWGLVWFVIWPNLKKVLGPTPVDAVAKQRAREKVRAFARKNLVLSIPVTFAMVAAQNLF